MATIYFGADVYPSGRSANGNWQDLTQWYSDPGTPAYKSIPAIPATPLGRLPYNTDTVNSSYQNILSNVGYWNGAYPAGSWVAGSFSGNVNNCNCALAVTWGGAISSGNLQNCTVTGSLGGYAIVLTNVSASTATFGTNFPIYVSGTTTLPSTLTNVGVRLLNGTFNTNLTFNASYYDNSYQAAVIIYGGTFNGTINFTATYSFFFQANFAIFGGTINSNINTSVTGIRDYGFWGGTIGQSGDLILGTSSLRANATFNINVPSWALVQNPSITPTFSTSKNITMYSRGSQPGTWQGSYIYFGINGSTTDTNVYSGTINIYNTTESLSNYLTDLHIYSGIYSPPVTLPIINKTGGTGKGVNTALFPSTWGFLQFQPNLYVSGSSDILQSELA